MIYLIDSELKELRKANLETIKFEQSTGRKGYTTSISAFDIETSNLVKVDEAIMYVWQFALEGQGTFLGRTWDDFRFFIDVVNDRLEETDSKLICFVHNLSFEFQFLRTILKFETDDVFVVKSRKILRAVYKRVEFRCSYLLTNLSLDAFTQRMEVEHKKLSGVDYNYDIVRYPWTELEWREIEYCHNDVVGLIEAVRVYMAVEKDTLDTLPLTSTGFVRRDAKDAMYPHVRRIRDTLPGEYEYTLLREAFRGGNTHANRYYAGRVINNVYSADRSSSYPDVQVNCQYPVERFCHIGCVEVPTLDKYIDRGKACIFRAIFCDIQLRDRYWGCPYLSLDKSRGVSGEVIDNGRILLAATLETTLTDIDWRIVTEQYTWTSCIITDLCIAKYGKLPRELIDTTIDYYQRKTRLKGVKGEALYYHKAKEKLNSIYGMMAQDPCKKTIKLKGLEYVEEDRPISEILLDYNKHAFLPYQWGVWVTAWARLRLEEGLRIAGDDYVYCDTDSIKSLSPIDFGIYNRKRIESSTSNGAYATDSKGIIHYMGVFESEGRVDKFVTWGAKRYVTETEGEMKITVSGVSKARNKLGIQYAQIDIEEGGGIENFGPGTVFKKAGGLTAYYRDHEPSYIVVDGRVLECPSNVMLKQREYTLSISGDYEKIIKKMLDN